MMRAQGCWLYAVTVCFVVCEPIAAQEHKPLALHPDNSHYFLFRGKPTVLITSGEHYGAVLNLDFDYVKYLDTLAADGLNHTRTFTGAYAEPVGAFKIAKNTLAPAKGRLLAPWARSETPGYANGGNKFDLSKWSPAYFQRLKDFVAKAAKRDIVVEMNLFCPFYEDAMWALSPMHAGNNINGLGKVPRTDVYTLDKNGGLLAIQEALTKKIVTELNEFDNVFFEVCNEPYFGGVTQQWQDHIADLIVATEKKPSARHLISMNIANGAKKVEKPHPAVSIFNFHYASPPKTVALNYHLNKPIGDNETGFKGTAATHYRMEGWQFILAGGALYNNLDYSFAVGHEDGTFGYPPSQPGSGGKDFRKQIKALKTFIESFDFVRMKPDTSFIKGGLTNKCSAHALVEPGKQYAVYLFGDAVAKLELHLPKGKYQFRWLNPVIGETDKQFQVLDHAGGAVSVAVPKFAPDIALRLSSMP
jgi:hypothetical protein